MALEFEVGELVLAFHGPHIYPAKVRSARQVEHNMPELFPGVLNRATPMYRDAPCCLFPPSFRLTSIFLWDNLPPPPPSSSPLLFPLLLELSPHAFTWETRSFQVLKAEQGREQAYFIHYQKWSKKWDEWVDNTRILKHNEANLAKQAELKSQALPSKESKAPAKKKERKEMGTSQAAAKSKRRKLDADQETEEAAEEATVKILMPFTLKKRLVDDWEHVTQSKKLVRLPCTTTISQVLKQFLDSKKDRKGVTPQPYIEIIEGVRTFFERALGSILLYRFERLQYEAVKAEHPEANLADIYGVHHLLRLFVKLPQLLSGSDIGEEDMGVIKQKLHEFLKYV